MAWDVVIKNLEVEEGTTESILPIPKFVSTHGNLEAQ
jgi:hypothetical protein